MDTTQRLGLGPTRQASVNKGTTLKNTFLYKQKPHLLKEMRLNMSRREATRIYSLPRKVKGLRIQHAADAAWQIVFQLNFTTITPRQNW